MQDIEKIYKEYFETVNKYLFCLTRNSDISEELTQETFYKAVKKINTYKGECKMSVWLCQIAKNLWIDQCRKNKKISNLSEEDLINITEQKSLEEKIISDDEKIIYTTRNNKSYYNITRRWYCNSKVTIKRRYRNNFLVSSLFI